MGFASKRYVFGSSDSIKFLVSDWDSNHNRNFRYNKWTTEATPLHNTEHNTETGTSLLHYKNPAFVLTFIFLVGVFVLPGIFCLLVKLCLKINICPTYFRRPSSKGTIQPVSYNSQLPGNRTLNTNQNPRTSWNIDEEIVIEEDGWSVSNLHDATHNAITQTDVSHCVNPEDWVGIRILEQDNNSSLPPSYEEATRTVNTINSDSSAQNNHYSGEDGGTTSVDCAVDEGNAVCEARE